MAFRRARHAGSWYEDREPKLNQQLQQWLGNVDTSRLPRPPASVIDNAQSSGPSDEVAMPIANVKAIIAPHAGYSYSGPAAAYAYKCIDPTKYKRVFILGPSHKTYLDGCSLSACLQYETPLGDLSLDKKTITELRDSGKFLKDMTLSVDENEHSIEMHLPYIQKIFEEQDITIVPILVGAISSSQENAMGKFLSPYLKDKETLFVVSSDFCHWGSRFDYTYYKKDLNTEAKSLTSRDTMTIQSKTPIHTSIRALDGTAIRHLTYPSELTIPDASRLNDSTNSAHASNNEKCNSNRTASQAQKEFDTYLKKTRNTICGRHPIGVLMGALAALEDQGIKTELRFTRYEQSSEAISVSDSSVSYASAFVRLI